jgi:tRNA(fMet)-specific endonuclease VapC
LLSGTRYFLDANIIIFLMKGRNSALSRNFERAVIGGLRFLLPVLVRQEVEVGVLRNANVSGARAKLNRILSFVEGVVPYETEDGILAAEIHHDLLQRGVKVGPYDLLIAAQVLRRNGILVTNNVEEFSRINELQWVDWSKG